MKHILKLGILAILLTVACKKETSSHKIIGRIDISDANSLIFGSVIIDPHSGEDLSDSIRLYKLTTADEIHQVKIFSDEDDELIKEFVTDGIYSLNTGYFLFNVYHKNDQNKIVESYIVNKQDGVATQLTVPVIPAIYNGTNWIKGCESFGFASSNENTFYIPDGEKLNKINISINTVEQQSILINSPYYDIDTFGNILSGNKLIFSDKTTVQVPEIMEDNIIIKQFGPGFFIATIQSDSIKIKKLDIVTNNYVISNYGHIKADFSQWKYLGVASVRNLKCSCLIFNKGIIYIDSETIRSLSFTSLSLKSIKSYFTSNDGLLINGVNDLNKEVFFKTYPQLIPTSYTHIIAPDEYYYKIIQVSQNGGLSFFAKQVYGTKEVIGYRSTSHAVSILENDYAILVKQVLTLK